jgi:heavy metal-binding protein
MDARRDAAAYSCPMHPGVRQAQPGRCPTCGMNLVPEGARFKFLRHMLGSPMHIAVMAAIMIAVMATAMMMLR